MQPMFTKPTSNGILYTSTILPHAEQTAVCKNNCYQQITLHVVWMYTTEFFTISYQ